ncbi:glycoside hydrolase family 2 TIM barrel-domain containing protein [Microbacterium sp. NPDC056044]|uniref:glycoside hydrolase family 2 TIM barrel-domain containing protein n=1 Tax=Microbacterium sp. NPDC056044 TaxID=3345690 RepID=UPI0035DF0756
MTLIRPALAATDVALRDWVVRSDDGSEVNVRLPDDAMLRAGRGAKAPGGAEAGWFRGGDYEYRTVWAVPPGKAQAVLIFEGVQGDAEVTVNGHAVGMVRSGYVEAELTVTDAVRAGEANDIRVLVRHTDQPAERWYPGSGLYRRVRGVMRPLVHFGRDAVHVRTVRLESGRANVSVDVRLSGPAPQATVLEARLLSAGVVVAQGTLAGASGTIDLHVDDPRAWSADDPFRYDVQVTATSEGEPLDSWGAPVGLRTVAVDARQGLRVNGRRVLLAGACIHHDNGLLGAATHRAAEYRRVRLLKDAGFNAIRSAHNPLSRDLLDACDELGMYVLDELADYWFVRKTQFDHSGRFRETWREDTDALVAKDRNYACVIMYASGNEIPETATAAGVELSREITEYFHAADPTRPVTLAINLFLNAMVAMNASPYAVDGDGAEPAMAGSTEANVMINHIGRMMDIISRLPRADRASRDAFATVDIAGYNYGLARYKGDTRRYPHRVILGSETLPGDVAKAWRLVQDIPAVIGDFVWAGWEYLGEAGVAVWVPGKKAGLAKPYPYVVAGPGMFDLTGRPDASLRLAQAAWGVLDEPAITVRPLDRAGLPFVRSAWRITDAVESWAWRGCEGKRAEIAVYSAADEIELVVNGRSVGRRPVGEKAGYRATFTTPWQPGVVLAIAYRAGVEVSRSELRSAAEVLQAQAWPESDVLHADGDDLAFVHIQLADSDGVVEMLADDIVDIEVSGPAELVGYGTANPAPTASFLSSSTRTYRGRALAILRSTGEAGIVRVNARSRRHGVATADVLAVPTGEHDTKTASL